MASGDRCVFGLNPDGSSNGTVTHYDCDDYWNGTVTDIRTGIPIKTTNWSRGV